MVCCRYWFAGVRLGKVNTIVRTSPNRSQLKNSSMHTQVRPGVCFGNDRECRLFGRTQVRGLKQRNFELQSNNWPRICLCGHDFSLLLSATSFASAAEEVNIIDGATLTAMTSSPKSRKVNPYSKSRRSRQKTKAPLTISAVRITAICLRRSRHLRHARCSGQYDLSSRGPSI